jgi:hypothetical protein
VSDVLLGGLSDRLMANAWHPVPTLTAGQALLMEGLVISLELIAGCGKL